MQPDAGARSRLSLLDSGLLEDWTYVVAFLPSQVDTPVKDVLPRRLRTRLDKQIDHRCNEPNCMRGHGNEGGVMEILETENRNEHVERHQDRHRLAPFPVHAGTTEVSCILYHPIDS